jgi:serine phosphatase RsbU (regulator of sigma subunit)
VACPVGPPVGVEAPRRDLAGTVELPPGATLLAFSDGLVERRGEDLDAGLARLAAAAGASRLPLEETADRLLAELPDPRGKDDTVLLCLRWTGAGRAAVARRGPDPLTMVP